MLKIHDIKPIVEVPSYSLYLYYALIVLGVLFFLFLGYLLIKYFKKNKNDERKKYYKILKNINFSTPKQSAYELSKYGRLLIQTQRDKKLFDELHYLLDEYKYKKDVKEKFSNEVKVKYELFMESLDVR